MAKRRASIPAEVLQQVLLNSKRRCCICYEKGNTDVREGTISHLTKAADAPTIETEDNLVFLCHDHHKMLDSGRLSVDHIRKARAELYRSLERPPSTSDSDSPRDEYQKRIYTLFAAELDSTFPSLATVHFNRLYPGKSGCLREVDVSVTINVGGLRILIALDVKMSNRLITPSDVESFAGLVHDIGANKGLLISNKGFSPPAKRVANTLGIALAAVTDANADIKSGMVLDPLVSVEATHGS